MLHQFAKKFNAKNIYQFGKKFAENAHVFGRKFKNTLHTIGEIGGKALPIVESVAGMAGFPELGGAIPVAREGLGRVKRLQNNVEHINEQMRVFH